MLGASYESRPWRTPESPLLGDDEAVWKDSRYRTNLLGGIRWTMGAEGSRRSRLVCPAGTMIRTSYSVPTGWARRYLPGETPMTLRNTLPNALSDSYPTAEASAASFRGRPSRMIPAARTIRHSVR
jgi:hypothetical protein